MRLAASSAPRIADRPFRPVSYDADVVVRTGAHVRTMRPRSAESAAAYTFEERL